MHKNVFETVMTELRQVLGNHHGAINLSIVGENLFSLHLPEGTFPNCPEVRIESAAPHEIVPKCKEALGI